MVGEVDPRARFRVAGVDLGEVDPGGIDPGRIDPEGADHLLAASVCWSQDRWAEPGRWSRLQGLWLELRGLGGSRQPEALESPLSRSIQLVVLAAKS